MFGFLTPTRRDETGPLANVAAADKFWRSLPRNDPLAAQKASARPWPTWPRRKDLNRGPAARAARPRPAVALATRRAARQLRLTRNPQAQPFERRYWRAAVELSQAFAAALRPIPEPSCGTSQAPVAGASTRPAVVLRLFRHRQVEFLLRPFLNDAPIPETFGPSSIRPTSSRMPRAGRIIRSPRRATGPGRHRDHAAERVRPYPAARIDERRPVLPVRRVLA